MPPPGLTPPMDHGALTPDHPVMQPPMSMTPNGPMIPMYGPGGIPLTNAGQMTGPSPSSMSPQQMDGRLSGPPPQMQPHPGMPPHFPRRISFPPADFKIYEMCRKLQLKPEVCRSIYVVNLRISLIFSLQVKLNLKKYFIFRTATIFGGISLYRSFSKMMPHIP